MSVNEQANGKERIGLRELARRLERSPSYVHGLKTRGVLIFGPDGLIEEEAARAAIAAAKDPAKRYMQAVNDRQRAKHRGTVLPPHDANGSSTSASYMRAKTAREGYGAKIAQLDYEERIGLLINAKEAHDAQFQLARQVRDRMLVIPDRLSALLAAETDQTKVREILSREIKLALSKALADPEEVAK